MEREQELFEISPFSGNERRQNASSRRPVRARQSLKSWCSFFSSMFATGSPSASAAGGMIIPDSPGGTTMMGGIIAQMKRKQLDSMPPSPLVLHTTSPPKLRPPPVAEPASRPNLSQLLRETDLEARCVELEARIADLETEKASLRAQLAMQAGSLQKSLREANSSHRARIDALVQEKKGLEARIRRYVSLRSMCCAMVPAAGASGSFMALWSSCVVARLICGLTLVLGIFVSTVCLGIAVDCST